MSQIDTAHLHGPYPLIAAGDADWILTTTDMTAAGSTSTFTHDFLWYGAGRLELSKNSSGSATVYLTYKTPSGAKIVEEPHTFTATAGTYSDFACAELITVRWEALAENLTIGAITRLYIYADEYMGPDECITKCTCQVSTSSIVDIATKDTNWGFQESTRCFWILVSAITANSINVYFYQQPVPES